jgi:hypothetical protein
MYVPPSGSSSGTVVFAWKGQTGTKVWYEAEIPFTGTFTPQAVIPSAATNAAPALGVFGTSLHASWKGTNKGKVYYSFTS